MHITINFILRIFTNYHLVVFMALLPILFSSSCSSSVPKVVEIELVLVKGELDDDNIFQGKQNDTVQFSIRSDQQGIVHIHGYDIQIPVATNTLEQFSLEAETTGRFILAFHGDKQGDIHESHENILDLKTHGAIFMSNNLVKNNSYSFMFTEDHLGSSIPYHNHVNPSMSGVILVGEKSTDDAKIIINAETFNPSSLHVSPGDRVEWINESDQMVIIVSGDHDIGDPDEHAHEHPDEVVETEFGYLEILPR